MNNAKKQLIQNIQEIETEAIQLYEKICKTVPDDANNLFHVCNSYCMRIDKIKNGIYTLWVNNNIYPGKILIRALIEHYFRLLLIYINGEKYAEYYDKHLLYNEIFEYCKSEKFIHTNLKNDTMEYDIDKKMEAYEKGSTSISKSERDKINALFHYKEIWKSLIPEMKKSAEFFAPIITEYSKLSSYVHGGPYAGLYDFVYSQNIKNRENKMKDLLKSAITLNIGAKIYTSFTINNIDKLETCARFDDVKKKIIDKIENFYLDLG